MDADFSDVTEIVGDPISAEQLFRLHHRYSWAATFSSGRDVVECACGTGPGLGVLGRAASSLEAGDLSPSFVDAACRHYRERFRITIGDAQALSFADESKDVIVLFEAIYYLRDARAFVSECARVLRRGGHVLIATANKDLWDFHPSIHSQTYYGVRELRELLSRQGFDCEFFGFQDVQRSNLRQRLLRPLKRLAVAANWMPRTMAGKRWLKRIVFGAEVRMPAELAPDSHVYVAPERISGEAPDKRHRIIYCAARLRGAAAASKTRFGEAP